MADAVGEAAGERRQDRADRPPPAPAEAGGQRRPSPDVLEERRHQHQPAERRADEQRLGDVADRERAQPEQVEVEQRRRVPRRTDEEPRQQHGGDGQADDETGIAEAPSRSPRR
jgi:hypothetical protein